MKRDRPRQVTVARTKRPSPATSAVAHRLRAPRGMLAPPLDVRRRIPGLATGEYAERLTSVAATAFAIVAFDLDHLTFGGQSDTRTSRALPSRGIRSPLRRSVCRLRSPSSCAARRAKAASATTGYLTSPVQPITVRPGMGHDLGIVLLSRAA